jgi:dihydrolipoamide dehydrogenase
VCAIRLGQLGQKVACVEEEEYGGVCLNWGCIPSKSLLTGAELVESLRAHGEAFGVDAQGVTLDYGKAIATSRRAADRLCKGVEALFRKNRITLIPGRARLAGPRAIEVSGSEDVRLEAGHVLLATGSAEWVPPGVTVDGRRVLTSREALESKLIPERILIVGAGAVGCEFAYVYAMYGARVTLIEMADQLLPGADAELAAGLLREFRRKGIEVRLGTRFEELKTTNGTVRAVFRREGVHEELEAEQVLIAVGRRPLSDDLGLEAAGVERDGRGFVATDRRLRTAAPSVSAIGDLVGAPLLAHKASEEGVAVAEWLAGVARPELDAWKIPSCIYCQPQVAWIGRTEAQAREEFGEIRVGRFPFTASGKGVASGHTAGFVKILAEPRTGEIVGAHVLGWGATELIAELGLAMTLEATPGEIAATSHAHPTLAEAILEAALAAEGRGINL